MLKTSITSADKIKSLKDLKKELKALFSINGYSKILDTKSPVKKVFSLVCMIALFVGCMYFVDLNVKDFQTYDIVTQIKSLNYELLTFPAVTFCLLDRSQEPIISRNLSEVLIATHFDSINNTFSINDFEYFKVYAPDMELHQNCFKFNGGRNALNHEIELQSTQDIGYESGLNMILKPSNDSLFYFVGDNKVRPTNVDLDRSIYLNKAPELLISLRIQKTDDIKLPFPYSKCDRNINSRTSYLAKEIIENNMTYRQINCFEMCYHNYLARFAESRKISVRDAYDVVVFDFKGNCSKLCPLECTSTTFEISKNEFKLSPSDPISLRMTFYYSDRKYTEITQSIKMKLSDFISNTGGLLGLFLDLSFFSAYGFIIFMLDLIFV